ncbi:macro domain-containing protein [Burkholderia cepacia]|uniref:macro domain-containing protein n=1 Tax=Burkholderia cepacia TaxID=292 RepID=UPI002019B75D|nr:macro domain-containing protein [Burkholderia cepacia]UQO50888.1 DUF6430 domain-containing protein [Burkholderia cepacia]UQP05047.1 DUF6430 domain-containing protein [Burkholderia cepacia]
MKGLALAIFSVGYWKHGFSIRKAASSLLAAFGVLWLLVSIFTFFSQPEIADHIKNYWPLFLLLGVLWTIYENWPRHLVRCRLDNRDVHISIRVGDLFSGDTSVIVGCNTSFDTDMSGNLISRKSVQGQYTTRYFDSVNHLDAEINDSLRNIAPESTNQNKPGKVNIYPIGTTVTLRARNRTAYFCAISRMNAQGNAESSFEDIKSCLPKLWEYITAAGDHGNIAIPVLGTGFSRLPNPRAEIIREIVQSFVAACAAQKPCDSLSIVIQPKDFYRHEVNLTELGRFLEHVCKYTNFVGANAGGRGQALPDVPAANPGAI